MKDKIKFLDSDVFSYKKQLEGLNRNELIEKSTHQYRKMWVILGFWFLLLVVGILAGGVLGTVSPMWDTGSDKHEAALMKSLTHYCETVSGSRYVSAWLHTNGVIGLVCEDRSFRLE